MNVILAYIKFKEGEKMSKDRDRTVYRRNDGKWSNKRNDAGKASSIHKTQQDAIDSAERMLKNQGGGEITIMGRNGRIRSNTSKRSGGFRTGGMCTGDEYLPSHIPATAAFRQAKAG